MKNRYTNRLYEYFTPTTQDTILSDIDALKKTSESLKLDLSNNTWMEKGENWHAITNLGQIAQKLNSDNHLEFPAKNLIFNNMEAKGTLTVNGKEFEQRINEIKVDYDAEISSLKKPN